MNNGEVGDLILRQLYKVRQKEGFVRIPEEVNLPDIDPDVVIDISSALGKRGLIRYYRTGPHKSGLAKILPRGIDLVEKTEPPISLDQSVSIHGSQNMMSANTVNDARVSINERAEKSPFQRFSEWVRKTIWSSGG